MDRHAVGRAVVTGPDQPQAQAPQSKPPPPSIGATPASTARGTTETASEAGPASSAPSTARPAHRGPPRAAFRAAFRPAKASSTPCRYFGTESGCRSGDRCPYLHDAAATRAANQRRLDDPAASRRAPARDPRAPPRPVTTDNDRVASTQQGQTSLARGRQYVHEPADPSRVVRRPEPAAQRDDPHEFQIRQLRRRFSPRETERASGTSFALRLVPSDPDFAFDVDALECVLEVPRDHPGGTAPPTLAVTDAKLPRGHQVNVERGFDELVRSRRRSTLLQLMNALDRNLERFLAEEETPTVIIVPNRPAVHPKEQRVERPSVPVPRQASTSAQHGPDRVSSSPSRSQPASFDSSQRVAAKARRDAEIRQLEARLGRQPGFAKLTDRSYHVPLNPPSRGDLPVPLQGLRSCSLVVPDLYPLEPCRIGLVDVAPEAARGTEGAFEMRAKEHPDMSLMAHVNYLTQNLYVLATQGCEGKAPEARPVTRPQTPELAHTEASGAEQPEEAVDDDRPHLKVIPRPPEWATDHEEDGDEDPGLTTSESDAESDDMEPASTAHGPGDDGEEGRRPTPRSERGTAISFPSIELYGIELLDLASIGVVVRCERCKTVADVTGLKHGAAPGEPARPKLSSCSKCANPMSVGYRGELIHAHSGRAGFLDLEGCSAVDLLPSHFIPTCTSCSTPHPPPGIVSVRGDTSFAFCRQCHCRMSFRFHEAKFLIVAAAGNARGLLVRPKKPKEKLGITVGQELPRRGRCSHYGKSYRWFRFSCCAKVFPCDKCHDAVAEHPNEHANRMICGLCSREQNYRPESCAFCHSVLVGRKGSGFWEGGKGTRDKTRMSRKDPRKYKRRLV